MLRLLKGLHDFWLRGSRAPTPTALRRRAPALGNALAYSGEVDDDVAAYERAVELWEAQQDCARHRATVLAELQRVRGLPATEDSARESFAPSPAANFGSRPR